MAITALNSAATGLKALSTRIDVISNNLANAETTAFKGSRANFEDLMYLTLKQPGAQTANNEITPAGIFVGLGTKLSNTQLDMTQGSLSNTGGPLDVAIQGSGFFKVKVLDSVGNGFAYTRNGAFFVNDQGEMVVGMGDGYRLQPPITIPPGANNITISQDGQVSYQKPGSTANTVAGQMTISQFINPQGLDLLGGSACTSRPMPPAPRVGQGQPRRKWSRPNDAELSGREQRRSGQRAGHPDQNAAKLRAEQPVDPDG